MTDGVESTKLRPKTAQHPAADSAFVVGALAAMAGVALTFIEAGLDPLWFFGGAIVFLAIGSLGRSATVVRWDRREPAWAPIVQQLENRLVDAASRHDAELGQLAADQATTAEALTEAQTSLAQRFDGMEQWVAKHAVPFIQNPESTLGPAVRRMTRQTTQEMEAMKEDVKGLKRQCEAAIRAFAALPPGNEMADWPATIRGMETAIAGLRDRFEAASGQHHDLADQMATLQDAVQNLNESRVTSHEHLQLVRRQSEALEDKVRALAIESDQELGRRLDAMKAAIMADLPDLQAQTEAVRDRVQQRLETTRPALGPTDPASSLAALRRDVEALPTRVEHALAEVRQALSATHAGPACQHAGDTPPAGGSMLDRADTREMARPAIVEAPSPAGPIRAHNPHGAKPGAATDGAGDRVAERPSAAAPTGKPERQRRVAATRRLVGRPRRR